METVAVDGLGCIPSIPTPYLGPFSIKIAVVHLLCRVVSFPLTALLRAVKSKWPMENLTASEIAGFGVGTLLLCATIAVTKVDAFISSSQRSSLGMCKRCGDLKMIACSHCKGVGSAKNGGPFSFIMLEEISESLGDGRTQKQLMPCIKCQSKGRLPCPNCLKLS